MKRNALLTLATLLLAPLAAQHAAESEAGFPPADQCAVSPRPLTNWTSGSLTGNGDMGVIMGGEPYAETLVVNAKLYLPLGSKEVLPDLGAFRDEFKKAGLAAGRDGPAVVHRLMVNKSGQKLVDTDPFHPAFSSRPPRRTQLPHTRVDERQARPRRNRRYQHRNHPMRNLCNLPVVVTAGRAGNFPTIGRPRRVEFQ